MINEEVMFDLIRIFFMSFYTYLLNLKIIEYKYRSVRNIIKIILEALFVVFACEYSGRLLGIPYIVIWNALMISIIFMIDTKNDIGYSILVTTVSLSINYAIYTVSLVTIFILNKFIDVDERYTNFLFIILIYNLLINLFKRIKRIKKGFDFLQKKLKNEYFNVLVLNISIIILFFIIIFINSDIEESKILLTAIVISTFIMFITIQKSLQLYYKQRMLVKDLEETKEELENKKKEVEQLEKENLEFSKVSHSIAHKQKSLEYKLNELSMKNEITDEIDIKDRIKNLNKGIKEENILVLDRTGITQIDDMLIFMQSECVKNKIDFQLQLSGNIYTMINHYIDKDELEILLADHIKNAIIAIGYGDNINKSILVRLGKLDGNYGLYIYDSGIEFEIETLLNLGKKPSTTHKDSGGTGMGFMNTFDTLKKNKASFIIEEYGKPIKDNFTKALKFKFDNNCEFKIYSYREEQIKIKDKENDLVVEKLPF